MSTSLTKLYVRFIQTQQTFTLESKQQKQKYSTSALYIKDNSSFYLVNNEGSLSSGEKMTLNFSEKNDYLKGLKCKVETTLLESGSTEYETALLFFNVEPRTVKQVLLLKIVAIEEKA